MESREEHPILFSGRMIEAILAGRKTQTRRVSLFPSWVSSVKNIGAWWEGTGNHPAGECESSRCAHIGGLCGNGSFSSFSLRSPYGSPGDRLYVKEASWIWCRKAEDGETAKGRTKYRYYPHGRFIHYAVDHPIKPEREKYAEPNMVWRYKTARFMPRWASRITLEITEVLVQRLNEISEEDAKEEGASPADYATGRECILEPSKGSYRLHFKSIWESINAKRGFGWDKNPWVWAVTFRII